MSQIHKYKPKKRFSDRVEKYARYRPAYPRKLIDVLKNSCQLKSGAVIADIGSGTGIFSRLLLENGFRVFAVEPNAPMRHYAEQTLSGYPGFTSRSGSAENTALADESMDAVTAAQAFHWFETEPTIAEINRILRPNGLLALIWNERKVEINQFHKAYEAALLKYCSEYDAVNHKQFTMKKIRQIFPDKQITRYHFENFQLFDLPSLTGRLESSSYCPQAQDKNYQPLMDALKNIFDRFQESGRIKKEYDCVMYCIRL